MNTITLRVLAAFLGLIFAVILMSCGKKDVKPASQESRLAQEAFQLAETIRQAYINNDLSTLKDNSTNNGYMELSSSMKKFDKADLSFTPTWIEIRDSLVFLSLSWKGVWTVGAKSRGERGLAIFVLDGSPLKLAAVQRDNPFRQPE